MFGHGPTWILHWFLVVIVGAFVFDPSKHLVLYLILAEFAAHTLYTALEIKHLVTKDGIAEPLTIGAIVFFGGLSVSSIIVTVLYTCYTAILIFPQQPYLTIVPISLVLAIGAAWGCYDMYPYDIYLTPLHAIRIIRKWANPRSLLLTCGLASLLAISSSIFYALYLA